MARKSKRKLSDHETASLTEAFQEHERYLWALCYRLTGMAADADDVLQATFARVVERPPQRPNFNWQPWLVRIAMTLGRDLLRRRKFRGYTGQWLPSPLELPEFGADRNQLARGRRTTARYSMMESATFAFLAALEELTPSQRTVLVLRDVFDYSVRETSAALDIAQGNVKTTLHRARHSMARYDGVPRLPHAERHAQTGRALSRFMSAAIAQDASTVESMLRDDVRSVTDSGGMYNAPQKPVVGIKRVARLFLKLGLRYDAADKSEVRTLNGLPALITRITPRSRREAPLSVISLDVDKSGKIGGVFVVMAPQKLADISL